MKFLVFGSLNIDRVYSLPHLPEKGETLACSKYEIHVGGKGLNQSVSLSKAGADVHMAGFIGQDGGFLVDFLKNAGVNTDLINVTDGFSGHAVIEVDPDGQNQMVLFPGANREITAEYCDKVLEGFGAGDLVLLQYETSQVEYMIDLAHSKGMKVAINPSPYVDELKKLNYGKIDYLILNESEGQGIAGEKDIDTVVKKLLDMLDGGAIILTLGGDGAIYADRDRFEKVPAFDADVVDTTGAGDTFTGYCLTALLDGADPKSALITASAASAIVVSKAGAAETIPERKDVEKLLKSVL